MPRKVERQEGLGISEREKAVADGRQDEWVDALVVEGVDPQAEHRRRIRELNTRRQRVEEIGAHPRARGLLPGGPGALLRAQQTQRYRNAQPREETRT